MYELLPTAEEGSAELHHIEAEQEPNQASNELLTNLEQEGKPWSITLILKFMQYLCYLCLCI